jgi:hypothetical protein
VQERQFNVRRSMSPAIHNSPSFGHNSSAPISASPHLPIARPLSPFGMPSASPSGSMFVASSPVSSGLLLRAASAHAREWRHSEVSHQCWLAEFEFSRSHSRRHARGPLRRSPGTRSISTSRNGGLTCLIVCTYSQPMSDCIPCL